jgi:hypothetical protein
MARRTKKATRKKKAKRATSNARTQRIKRAAAIKQLAKKGGTPRAKAKTRVDRTGATGTDWK